MKLNLAICSVLLLTSWWQQPLGETYDLRYLNIVMISDSFVFKKTKSCWKHALLLLRLTLANLSAFLIEWQGANREWSNNIILTSPLVTKTQNSLTRFTSIRLVKQEDLCGAIALTYFAENCLDLLLNGI